MSGGRGLLALALAVATAGCVSNTSPGNDREAQLDPPAPAAEVLPAGAAITGVSPDLLQPEVITAADLAAVTLPAGGCSFRFTRVDFPAFLYTRGAGAGGIMKLNGRLATLEGSGSGDFASGGVRVRIRPVDGGSAAEAGLHQAELMLTLPGARHELGYRGFAECG